MSRFGRNSTKLPIEQEATREKCFHPSEAFTEFKREEIEQSEARVVITDNANLSLARELTPLPVINIDQLDGR
jgi:hypothetical protein